MFRCEFLSYIKQLDIMHDSNVFEATTNKSISFIYAR